MQNLADRPQFTAAEAADVARALFEVQGAAEELPSDRDQNFRIRTAHGSCVLKVAHRDEDRAVLVMQQRALRHLEQQRDLHPWRVGPVFPRVVTAPGGDAIFDVGGHFVRMLSWVEGTPLSEARRSAGLLVDVGRFLGETTRAMRGFDHPAGRRRIVWNAADPGWVAKRSEVHADLDDRRLVLDCLEALPDVTGLPRSVVHNDANDHNLLVDETGRSVAGLIDFGDMVHAPTVCEPAVAIAYAMLGTREPLAAARAIAHGFQEVVPLGEDECAALLPLAAMRLALSVTLSAIQHAEEPDNAYLTVSEAPAWETLRRLVGTDLAAAGRAFHRPAAAERDHDAILDLRRRHLGPTFSTSYRQPLKIVRGHMQYLYDDTGRAYLDVMNNVNHVGHAHPRVTRAARLQDARLNTNTRVLHDHLAEYARRLVDLFPDPLSVCFFVNSGSEANDLALRLARTHTGRRGAVVLEAAYHGHLSSLIDISPYKFDRRGGAGCPPDTHVVPLPCTYRGRYRGADAGTAYAAHVAEGLAAGDKACFIAESLLGCGGQIVLPEGFLAAAHAHARAAGAVCIADEVQVGFGRVGEAFWGFELQGVVPDIVTLGKPIGNGHPLAAVVTTPEVARSFDTGMEYFNTYGGNPVSCAVGLAVLDVLEDEGLQQHARRVGARLLEGLAELPARHALVGDVRGRGLFVGVELVRDRTTLEPADTETHDVSERMKAAGILVSVDGPWENVLKIKPPLCFHEDDADRFVETLDRVLTERG